MTALPEKPAWLYLEINNVCNLRCKQCHIWMNRAAEPGTLQLDEQKRILRDFAEWPGSAPARVVLGGGEPLLNPDRVLPLIRHARELDLRIEILTNGSLIDESMAFELLERPPAALHVSIDAPRAEVHDRIRGVRGAFDRVVENVRRLHARRGNRGMELSINALICKSTLPYLAEHVRFLRELGADRVRFLPLAPTIGASRAKDPFFESESRIAEEDLVQHLDPLLRTAGEDAFIVNSAADLDFIRRYFAAPESVLGKEAVCEAGAKTMMIDRFGGVTFCYYMVPVFGDRPAHNVRRPGQSLRDLWNNDSSREFRRRMLKCQEPCGLLSCHRQNGPV
jgi:MoaA/NifB/PqqE/SkfB family radical SAM enzyme